MFNIAGLTTDSVLFALILARAIRLQSTFRIGETSNSRETSFVSTMGRVSGRRKKPDFSHPVRINRLLFYVRSSFVSTLLGDFTEIYPISSMLLMYSVTFVAYRLKPEDAVFQNGLVTLMAVMTGIMAPKLLLDIRRGVLRRRGKSLVRNADAWNYNMANRRTIPTRL